MYPSAFAVTRIFLKTGLVVLMEVIITVLAGCTASSDNSTGVWDAASFFFPVQEINAEISKQKTRIHLRLLNRLLITSHRSPFLLHLHFPFIIRLCFQ